VYGAAICFFMALAFFGTAGSRATARTVVRMPFTAQLRTGLANAPFTALLGTKFTQLFGLFTSNAMLVYVVAYVLGKDEPGRWMLYFTVAGAIGQVASIPLWNAIARRFEKQRTYSLATAIYCGMSLTWLLASSAEPLWFFCFRGLLKGCAASGLLLMGQSMLPDTIEYDHRRTGLQRAGIFSGLYSLVEKVAATFAPTILLFTYAWFGFDSKAEMQSIESIDGIRLAAALLPCLYFLASFVPLYFYRLTARDLSSAQRIA
jgi:glycoside/pentoside/hexuronide:cation symporter, GPH family